MVEEEEYEEQEEEEKKKKKLGQRYASLWASWDRTLFLVCFSACFDARTVCVCVRVFVCARTWGVHKYMRTCAYKVYRTSVSFNA